MKILLLTPLYPPDIAPPAPYVKELAKRLSKGHEVAIVAYGRLPEQVEGVAITAVPKNRTLLIRLFDYTFKLLKATKNADVIYAQNGASVELPLFIVSFFTSTPIVLGFGDAAAHTRTNKHVVLRYLERMVRARAKKLVSDFPIPRPIILPFQPYPTEALVAYEKSWEQHIQTLENIFTHAK